MRWLWIYATVAVALYCFARGMLDLRNKKMMWGALGVICAVVILVNPIPSRTPAVKINLPH